MNPEIIKFITKERVCVLSVVLADGFPHNAVLHYSQQTEPVKFFMQTYPTVKVQAIQEKGGKTKAALVVGLNEEEFISLQMRGNIRIVSDPKELEQICKIHYSKHPDAEKYKGQETVFLEFMPIWWRYTDFKTDPETIAENSPTEARG